MKKTLLTLGSITSVATPIIAVVSCGTSDTNKTVPVYSDYNMRSIYDMKAADKTKLTSLIVDANKAKTFDEFKALVKAQSMDVANEKMVNIIMEHYQDAAGRITIGWHVLHFALASTDDAQLKMASMGWKAIDGDDEDRSQATAAVKAYILNGTINTREMAKSIIDKFAGRESEKFNTVMIQMALKIDEENHRFIKVEPLAGTALQAMGGEETLKAILDHGTGQTWTIEDAPAA